MNAKKKKSTKKSKKNHKRKNPKKMEKEINLNEQNNHHYVPPGEELENDVAIFLEHFEKMINHAFKLHDQDQVFKAYKIIQRLEESFKRHEKVKEEHKEAWDKIHEARKNAEKRINKIETEKRETERLIHELRSHEGWTKVNDKEGVQTYYRHESDTPVHSIKMEGVLESPMLNIMAVMMEHDLYMTWMPLLNEVSLVHQFTPSRKILHLRVSLPWPLAPREAVLYGYGVDALEDDSALIMIRSCTEDDVDADVLPPLDSKCTRVDTKIAGVLLKPITEHSTHVIMATNTDPKFSYIPYTILNWATKVLSWTMWTTLRDKCKIKEGSEYEKALRENEEVYGPLRAKLDQYFIARDERQEL